MNKKICALLLSAVMCFCFTACTNGNVQEEQSTISAASATQALTTATSTTAISTTVSAESTTFSQTAAKAKNKASTTAKPKSETTVSVSSTNVTKSKTTAKKKKKNSNKVTCTVNVECTAILDNMGKLKEGHDEFVPSDGYIIKGYKYNGKKGDTAYDALKKACKDNDIKLTARSTSYGVYISGINNLDEFDCGSQSGWLYSVNGNYPNTTCGNIEISTGDTIAFEYTCSQ